MDCACPQEALGLRVKQMEFYDKLASNMKNKDVGNANAETDGGGPVPDVAPAAAPSAMPLPAPAHCTFVLLG